MKKYISIVMFGFFLINTVSPLYSSWQNSWRAIKSKSQKLAVPQVKTIKRKFFCFMHPSKCTSQEANNARAWFGGASIGVILTILAAVGIVLNTQQKKELEEKIAPQVLQQLPTATPPPLNIEQSQAQPHINKLTLFQKMITESKNDAEKNMTINLMQEYVRNIPKNLLLYIPPELTVIPASEM